MVKSLSVFFPAFNEEKNIAPTVEKALAVLEKLKIPFEVLIINDGSSDNTKEVSEGLTKKYEQVKLINHPKNLGYGEALKSGFYNAKYDWIVFTDSDGQFDFSEIEKFLEKEDQADMVVGYRINRQDNLIRKINGWGWTLISNLLLGIRVRDIDCAFKLVKKEVIEKIPKLKSTRGGMISPELVALVRRQGFKIIEVPVHHFTRSTGEQTGASLKVILTSFAELFKLWWKFLKKKEFLAIVLVLGVAVFLRFYKIDGYMTFLGDEGRDALVVKGILVNHHMPLLGPVTSIGNIYLGPLYYYMMALPMAIFWLNPLAAAVQVAIIGVITVFLIWYLGKIWFGFWSGIVAAFLYAISPVTIIYGRSSWNPNPAPFFALLSILALYQAKRSGNYLWLILSGAAVAAAVQMHYLALILVPVFGMLWFYELLLIWRGKAVNKNFIKGTCLAIMTFLVVMSPLFLFDIRHNFLDTRAILAFFQDRQTTVNVNPLNSLERARPIYVNDLISRYLTGDNIGVASVVAILILLPVAVVLIRRFKKVPLSWPYLALGIWLLVGVLGLSLYKQTIYDHYLGFLNPVPYLLFGSLLALPVSGKIQKQHLVVAVLALTSLLTYLNLSISPLKIPPAYLVKRTQEVVKFVMASAGGQPFNFALLSAHNYDSAYQFYFEVYGDKPLQVPFGITDQLFVVCEDPVCSPINNPKYEIAGFGWSKIEYEKDFDGVKVYKLVHNPSGT